MLEGGEEEKRADAPQPDTLVLVCDDVNDTIELIDVINDIFVPEGLAIIPITVADCCYIGGVLHKHGFIYQPTGKKIFIAQKCNFFAIFGLKMAIFRIKSQYIKLYLSNFIK